MHSSSPFASRIFALIAALVTGAATAGCGTYGDPCLRTTDCGSGFACVEGKCEVDRGDTPIDGSFVDAPGASDAPRSFDGTSDGASTDTSREVSTPAADSTGSDTPRDLGRDGDGAETSVLDAPRDGAPSDAPVDAADARAATDTGSANDVAVGDVGADVDSGSVRDATLDGLDATG
jgi:hypothetical protein